MVAAVAQMVWLDRLLKVDAIKPDKTMSHIIEEDLKEEWINKTDRAFYNLVRWSQAGKVPGITGAADPYRDIDDYLANLLGYADIREIIFNYRPETDALLAGLGGPNAWTIYKALEAKRGE